MKKRILALLLCMALSLSGCAAMLERSHVSSTAHVDYAVEEDESILRAETYQGLVSSMLYFINGHRGSGVIRLYNYAGDVDADLAAARDEALQDPVGAFAVGTLGYSSTRILSYYEVKLTITYTHTLREVEAIPKVSGLSGVRQELARLVKEQKDSAVFLASSFSGGGDMVEKLLNLACYSAPELVRHHGMDGVTVSLYPETGTRRIIKVELPQLTAGAVAQEKEYARELETAAAAILEANPPAGEGYTVEELAAIVRNAHGGLDRYGTSEALGALSGEPVEVLGAVLAMEYLCQQCGIEAELVSGGDDVWLIVAAPEGFRHLLPESLFAAGEEEPGEEPENPFRLYTDMELAELGYEWDMALYPACVDEAAQALAADNQAEAGPETG